MMSVDKYLARRHNMLNYNCWDFIREVWQDLTGQDIGHRTPPSGSRLEMARKFAAEECEFERLDSCEDPCIVLFLRPKMLPHVGIFVRGKVLHLPEKSQARHDPIAVASLGFTETRFYRCK